MRRSRVIIELAGGLGNQMFQYAFYLKMKQLGYDCDLYFDVTRHIHNGPELDKVFGIQLNFTDKKTIDKLLDRNQDIISKIKRRLIGSSTSLFWEHDKDYDFKSEVFEQKRPIYLQGCWLSEKYFFDIEELVRQKFVFKNINEKSKLLATEIVENNNSISIHIRRGDYLKSSIHKNIDYPNYLKAALDNLKHYNHKPELYIFSDDINYAAEVAKQINIPGKDYKIIDWNSGLESFNDMYLMSLCKYNIIANSTFSWWGAWLNDNKSKQIISPAEWFTNPELNNNSILPEEWIIIPDFTSASFLE